MRPTAAIHYDPRLIEETVFHGQRDRCSSMEFEEARNRIYEVADADEREKLFADLYRSWFVRLALGRPVEQALQEQAIITEKVDNCLIVRATQASAGRTMSPGFITSPSGPWTRWSQMVSRWAWIALNASIAAESALIPCCGAPPAWLARPMKRICLTRAPFDESAM